LTGFFYFKGNIMTELSFERTSSRPHILNVHLKTGGKGRLIGVIDESGEGTFLSRRTEKHLFRKTNSFGINYELLASPGVQFKWIILDFNGQKYVSSRQYFLKKGSAMQFGNFELQLFVQLEKLNVMIARAFEASEQVKAIEGKRPDLFDEVI